MHMHIYACEGVMEVVEEDSESERHIVHVNEARYGCKCESE